MTKANTNFGTFEYRKVHTFIDNLGCAKQTFIHDTRASKRARDDVVAPQLQRDQSTISCRSIGRKITHDHVMYYDPASKRATISDDVHDDVVESIRGFIRND